MNYFQILIIIALAMLEGFCNNALAERIAFVIGNNDYHGLPKLRTAIGDADAMKLSLEKIGFKVKILKNVKHHDFRKSMDEFIEKVTLDDEVIFHYSGHGVAKNGFNHPLFIDQVQPDSEHDIKVLVQRLQAKQPRYIFAVFDACRNTPIESITRSLSTDIITRGFHPVDAAMGAFFLFSASEGEKALDQLGPTDKAATSVFTRVLLDYLNKPDLSLIDIAKGVQKDVHMLAKSINYQQFPDYSDKIKGYVMLNNSKIQNYDNLPSKLNVASISFLAFSIILMLIYYWKFIRQFEAKPVFRDGQSFVETPNLSKHISPSSKVMRSPAAPLSALRPRVYDRKINMINSISYVNFSSNNCNLASVSKDGTIKLWDIEAGRLLRTLAGHVDDVRAAAFSPDSGMLAGSDRGMFGTDNIINLWEVKTGRLARTLEGQAGNVYSITFSSDGQTLASGSGKGIFGSDNSVNIWNVKTGRLTRSFEGQAAAISSIAFSPDNRMLASGSFDNIVRLWEVETGGLTRTLLGHKSHVFSVAFSPNPDSLTLASGSKDATIKIWNASTGELTHTLEGHAGFIFSVAYSPDGRMLASGGGDNTIKLWDVGTGRLIRTLAMHTMGAISSVAFSQNGLRLAFGSEKEGLRLWDVSTGKVLLKIHALPKGEWVVIGEGAYVSSPNASQYLCLFINNQEKPVDDIFQDKWCKNTLA